MLDANDVTMSEGDQDDASHSFHYIFAPYASAYATRLTKYTHAADASNAVIIISEDGSGEAVECCRTRCSVILEMDDLTEALRYFHTIAVRERVYVFGPTELALHPSCVRSHHPESQYIDLVEDIIRNGDMRMDRTKAGTYSVFDRDLRFDLRESIPVLTTKRVFVRGVTEELLWMISGSTDAGALAYKGVKIWEANATRSYLDSIGMPDRAVNDLGPVYGFQWRHAGAEYIDKDTDYSGFGVDQILNVIDGIKSDPHSRRHVLSAWQVSDLTAMALPPCHSVAVQFYVRDRELSCSMYQRSVDVALGLPFNIASYAMLTCMIAQVCDLRPGDLSIKMGDCHIYVPHVPIIRDQCSRAPRPFPTLRLDPTIKDIDDFVAESICIEDYAPHPAIAMSMF
jgi:dihydrofolate reductase/thymidylate synthase